MDDFNQDLRNAGYLCEPDLAAAIRAALNTRPVAGAFLFGPIGTGKTFLPEVLARVLNAVFYFYQCFPGTREDDLMVKLLPSENTVSGIATFNGVLVEAIEASRHNGRRVILLLDEWDKTRPSADSFLLDFLQSGRIRFAGRTYEADLSRLIVFLTSNAERDISEPLLRRLPKIDYRPLTPYLVQQALLLTHEDHPYLHNAVVLYERCLIADLPKPATIQELRQFLDAITTLGGQADWDALVFEFVTKTEENHELLRRAETERSHWQQLYRPRLDPEAYAVKSRFPSPEARAAGAGQMPSLAEAHGFDDSLPAPAGQPDYSRSSGVLELTQTAYSELVRLVDQPGDRPDRLGDLAEVSGNLISINKPLLLSRVTDIKGLWGENGEVLLIEPRATWEDVKALPDWAPVKIVKFSKKEILAKADGLDLRWTPEKGAEIVVDLTKERVFKLCFGEGWGRSGEGKWIGKDGLIFRRYESSEARAVGAA